MSFSNEMSNGARTAPEDVSQAYVKYGPYVLQRCRRILGCEAAARDALQETFVRAWRRSDRFAIVEFKLAWLYRVAERCSFDLRETHRVPLDLLAKELADLRSALQVEDRDTVVKFLRALDGKLQPVAILRYVDEMGQEEIARVLGCSRQTVVNRLAAIGQRMAAFRAANLSWERKKGRPRSGAARR